MYNNRRIKKSGVFVGSVLLIAATVGAGVVQVSAAHPSRSNKPKTHGVAGNSKFIVPNNTLSPNHRYGVTVPIFDPSNNNFKDIPNNNKLIEIRSGRVLTAIQGETGYNRYYGRRGTEPAQWSADSSLLVWTITGRWGADTLAAVKIKEGRVIWQRSLLKLAQQAILPRTRAAAPRMYAAVKKAKEWDSSYYPDSFIVKVGTTGKTSFPLHVEADLTSNPKGDENTPTLESHLEAIVDSQGHFKVTKFKLG